MEADGGIRAFNLSGNRIEIGYHGEKRAQTSHKSPMPMLGYRRGGNGVYKAKPYAGKRHVNAENGA
jgi:hypothetical protein